MVSRILGEWNFVHKIDNLINQSTLSRDVIVILLSEKELNELMDELFEAYGGADLLDDDENTKDSMNLSQQTVEAASQDQQVYHKVATVYKQIYSTSYSLCQAI